jgi:hypothetical protein
MPVVHCDAFREQLTINFPAYEHALWDSSPRSLYDAMQVGDVGHTRDGKFQHLFNVFLSANDPSHQSYGVPEYHEPFQPGVPNHIDFIPMTFVQSELLSSSMDHRYMLLGSWVA